MRKVLLSIALLLLPSCQISLFSPTASGPLENTLPRTTTTRAIPAPEFTRLYGAPDPRPERTRIRVRILFSDGQESPISFEAGTQLVRALGFVLSKDALAGLRRVGVYRLQDPPVLVVSDIDHRNRYGDLQQDLKLADGDLIFIPGVSDSLLEEFFSVSGILATESL